MSVCAGPAVGEAFTHCPCRLQGLLQQHSQTPTHHSNYLGVHACKHGYRTVWAGPMTQHPLCADGTGISSGTLEVLYRMAYTYITVQRPLAGGQDGPCKLYGHRVNG